MSEIWINNLKAPFNDKRVRQALIYGLNRQQIINVAYKGFGQVANVYAAPTQWSYTDKGVNKYKFDPDKAGKLFDEAGWKTGSTGFAKKMAGSSPSGT